MRTELSLTVTCDDDRSALLLFQALSPDNVGAPKDMTFRMSTDANKLMVYVSSCRPSSAFSTVVAVLSDISVFREVWLLSQP